MRRRVTDQRLIHTVEDPLGQEADDYYAMADELRQRRAADPALRVVGNNVDHGELLRTVYLTGNEMEALREFRESFGSQHYSPTWRLALAAIDKLTSKPGGK